MHKKTEVPALDGIHRHPVHPDRRRNRDQLAGSPDLTGSRRDASDGIGVRTMTSLLEFRDDGGFLRQPVRERVDDNPMSLHVILGVWAFGSVLGVALFAALAMTALQVFP